MTGHPWITERLIAQQQEQITRNLAERRRRSTLPGRNRRFGGSR